MYLRKLQIEDAEFMLEWMHDKNVVSGMANNFASKNLEDCISFIKNASDDPTDNLHMAICDDSNEYLGTVSLKNINYNSRNAEYAITIRKKAMGTGCADFATSNILKIAFEEMGLCRVYLCVAECNKRAVNFYKRFGFVYEGTFREHIKIAGHIENLLWYSMLKEEYYKTL